jgi:uncharacterized protein
MSEQDNVQACQDMYAAFGRGDVAGIVSALSEGAQLHHGGSGVVPWGGRTLTGTAAWEQFFGDLLELFEPESFEPKTYLADGDTVVALGDFRFRAKPTGKPYETEWAMAWTFRDGKAVACRVYEDTEAQASSLAAD